MSKDSQPMKDSEI